MRILITNNRLADRAGSELFARDIAITLLRMGHTPILYSTRLGIVAEELRKATVPVVDNLNNLPVRPDIIHGHHHLDVMTALLSLQNVPAIYFCHGWMPWESTPLTFPRILRYVAVDEVCKDRLLYDGGIPEEKIDVMLNFVDLETFKPRAPLPDKPRRALIFSNAASENNYVGMIREACSRFNIEVDVIGIASGNATTEPEKILPCYDIVFAKAKAALEAMAVGNAVVVCDARGCGPMVSTQNFERLRSLNFGIRTMQNAITVENLADAVGKYDKDDALKVRDKLRGEAGVEKTAHRLLALYEKVIAEYKTMPAPDLSQEMRAAAAYFQWLSPSLKSPPRKPDEIKKPETPVKKFFGFRSRR